MPENYEKYTPDRMIEALKAASGVIAAAARHVGCSRNTVKAYMDRYPEVMAAWEEQYESIGDEWEGQLISLIRKPKHKDYFAALRFGLRTRYRKRGYGDRQEIEHSGFKMPEGFKITIVNKRQDADSDDADDD